MCVLQKMEEEMETKRKADEEQTAKLNFELAHQREEYTSLKTNFSNQTTVLERRKAEVKVRTIAVSNSVINTRLVAGAERIAGDGKDEARRT